MEGMDSSSMGSTFMQAGISEGANITNTVFQNWLNQRATQRMLDYNSPAMQMARFRAAGLNPNLIYSQGNAGNQASPVEFGAPDVNPFNHLEKVFAYRSAQRRVRADELSMKGQGLSNANAEREMQLKQYLNDIEEKKRDMGYWDSILKSQVAAQEEAVRKSVAERGHMSMQDQALKEDTKLKKLVGSEKEYFQQLRKHGIEKNDPVYLRMLLNLKNLFP